MHQSTFRFLSGFTSLFLVSTMLSTSALAQPQAPEPTPFGFFVTSVGVGNGADLGGLAGADAHCEQLAASVGAGRREWRAYLSTQAVGDTPAVNAVDRIGSGPWGNINGVPIASDIDSLLYDNSNMSYEYVLTEKGEKIGSRAKGDKVVRHDILTGSTITGTAYPSGEDMTCNNWTSNDEGKAVVGHSDRHRGANPGSPWNSSHNSRGCSQDALKASGGDGLLYCFAAD